MAKFDKMLFKGPQAHVNVNCSQFGIEKLKTCPGKTEVFEKTQGAVFDRA
jgi:hypothetical protein